ncbi:MAG TPA: cytochrome c biogenesis protein [Candidatus Limnocylindrales bacterium]|nr:cytochrome c biogenesis protein [Candidatus Limnocylindrales bacterium]
MSIELPRWMGGVGRALWAAALLMLAISLWMIVARAPIEAQMGIVQKIVYVHVPSAIMTLLAFGLTFAASIAYLTTKSWVWDAIAASACELGLVFATVVMVTGPLWARSAWNTWWTWEPRLTTFLILWILYAGYHVVRASLHASARRTVSSILGVVLFVNLPIVWKSVEWWRGSLHPRNVTMTGEMRETLLFSMAAWFVFLAAAFVTRLRVEWAREAARERDGAPARQAAPGRVSA